METSKVKPDSVNFTDEAPCCRWCAHVNSYTNDFGYGDYMSVFECDIVDFSPKHEIYIDDCLCELFKSSLGGKSNE